MGKKGTDRGLLLILATDDRKYRIEVGYGLEGILPDGRVGDIGRAMVPYLRQNDYDGAVTMAVRQIAGVIAADAGVTLNTGPRPTYAPAQQAKPLTLGEVLVLGVILLLVIFFLARVGGSGLLGFLIGMFMGGGGGGGVGWTAEAVVAETGAAAETAAASVDLVAAVPVAVGPQAVGSLMKLIKNRAR